MRHSQSHQPDESLLQAVARAWSWRKEIVASKVESITDLGRKEGYDECFIRQRLTLANLAPDIIESILMGNNPQCLYLTKAKSNVPTDWKEQRSVYGT